MGTNTTSPWPPRTGCDCCLPEKVVQVPTYLLLLFPCSKPEVFLCPGKEAPSTAGCCSLHLEQLSTVGQTLTPVSSTHPARRCWEWALSSPSVLLLLPVVPVAFLPCLQPSGTLLQRCSAPTSAALHSPGNATRFPCPSASLLLLPQAVQFISSSQDLPCHPSLIA